MIFHLSQGFLFENRNDTMFKKKKKKIQDVS